MVRGKYGLPGTHDARCNCTDCNRMYLEHNRAERCSCVDCVAHREINTPPPRVTTAAEIEAERQKNYFGASRKSYPQPPVPKKGRTMGNLNICIRTECNAIIKGDAAGRVQFAPNNLAVAEDYVLCPACSAEVDALLHSAPVTDRQKAYDKPYNGWTEETNGELKDMTTEQLAAELFQRTMKDAQRTIEGRK